MKMLLGRDMEAMQTDLFSASLLILALVFPFVSFAETGLTITELERSPLFGKYKYIEKDAWNLRSGGTNHYYRFNDLENQYSAFTIEATSKDGFIKRTSISWHGKSTYNPATLTKIKEDFLRTLIEVTYSSVDPDNVVAYVKKQQNKNYSGGSGAMPRITIKNVNIYSGTVGEALIVGIEQSDP